MIKQEIKNGNVSVSLMRAEIKKGLYICVLEVFGLLGGPGGNDLEAQGKLEDLGGTLCWVFWGALGTFLGLF